MTGVATASVGSASGDCFQGRNKIVVGVGDMKLSKDPHDVLVTFALGSCVGIAIYDAQTKVGGILHAMLPKADTVVSKRAINPWMFVDTGTPDLFKSCYELGAVKPRLAVCVAGGARVMSNVDQDVFQIGKLNVEMTKALMEVNQIPVRSWDVGETHARTMSLDLTSGEVLVRTGRCEKML